MEGLIKKSILGKKRSVEALTIVESTQQIKKEEREKYIRERKMEEKYVREGKKEMKDVRDRKKKQKEDGRKKEENIQGKERK